MKQSDYRSQFYAVEEELISKFGRQRLEETGFPVYFNKFLPASYLGWSRVFTAQKLLSGMQGNSALDFGSGLGVSLPYLTKNYKRVVACELDIEVTEFMVRKLGLGSVELVRNISECKPDHWFDTIVALDVLEHVENLPAVFQSFRSVTANDGIWIISGPTETLFYKLARKIARTCGKGHVRTVYDVFNEIPGNMICEKVCQLPCGMPLFLIGRFGNIERESRLQGKTS